MSETWGERTAGDLSSLLVELTRAVKGLRFYEDGHDSRRDILDRSFLAWRVELDRTGPLELAVDEHFFRCIGVAEKLVHGHLADLAEAMRSRGLARVTITPELSRTAFHALAEILAMEEITIANRGGVARVFESKDTKGIELGGEVVPVSHSFAAPAAALDAEEKALHDTPMPPSEVEIDGEEHTQSVSLGSSLLGASRTAVEEFEDFTKPSLEENPLEATVSNQRDEELRALLGELDATADDEAYTDLVSHVVKEAVTLAESGMVNASYRAVLVLADHAVGHGGRSGVQLREAQSGLEELCSEERLDALIDRACDPEGAVSVRAAQVLLQLGGSAVPPLLDRLELERDRTRAAQISAVVIALGERAVPVLVAAILNPDTNQARIAVRLAGELQSPNLVQTLRTVMESDGANFDLDLRREAAHALVQIAGPDARDALMAALDSKQPGLSPVAVTALGTLGDPAAAPALLAHLDRAIPRWRDGTAREIIRALALLGSDAAVDKLVTLLERRTWRRRREQREVRLTVLGALGQLQGAKARVALEHATRHRDPQIRQLATRTLARRKG